MAAKKVAKKIRRTRIEPAQCTVKPPEVSPLEAAAPIAVPVAVVKESEKEPVPLVMAGVSLATAGLTAVLMFPLTAAATLTAMPLLMGVGLMRRSM